MQLQGSQNSPTSGEARAKWRVGTSTRVSINLNPRSCIENCVMSTGIQEQAMRQQVK